MTALEQARQSVVLTEMQWQPFHEGSPQKAGYYFVRDHRDRDGVAFMHRNKQWTLIDGFIRKPLVKWREIL